MDINKNDNPQFINDFITYQRVIKANSERTINEYYIDMRTFLRFLKMSDANMPYDEESFEQIVIKDITIDRIRRFTLSEAYEYLNFVAEKRGNSARSRARKASSLRCFFKYLTTKTMLLTENPVKNLELPSIKQSLPHFLSLEESTTLLKTVGKDEDDDALRDYCIITLFLNCGMRLSELVGMNLQDISFDERTLRLLGKGNKERIIYINDACIKSLQDYISSRENPGTEPNAVFLSKFHKRISRRRVQQIVEDKLREAGLDNKGLSTHKLRHTAATLMYQHGNIDTLVLKEVLGHKSIATTEIYTHVSSERMKNAAESSPLKSATKESTDKKQKSK